MSYFIVGEDISYLDSVSETFSSADKPRDILETGFYTVGISKCDDNGSLPPSLYAWYVRPFSSRYFRILDFKEVVSLSAPYPEQYGSQLAPIYYRPALFGPDPAVWVGRTTHHIDSEVIAFLRVLQRHPSAPYLDRGGHFSREAGPYIVRDERRSVVDRAAGIRGRLGRGLWGFRGGLRGRRGRSRRIAHCGLSRRVTLVIEKSALLSGTGDRFAG